MPEGPTILWFRNDLRLTDNRALYAAVEAGGAVLAVYVLDDGAMGPWRMGGASRWWLHHSIAALGTALEKAGCPLLIRCGDAVEEIAALAAETGARRVHCSRCYEPWAQQQERALHARLADSGVGLKRFPGALLKEPEYLRTKSGEPFKVYTPFWRALLADGAPNAPVPAPSRIRSMSHRPSGLRLASLDLLPSKPDWSGGLAQTWRPGEAAALARLDAFLMEGLAGYASNRDRPDLSGTSRLSPHMDFGELSPAIIWHGARAAFAGSRANEDDLDAFLREIGWREFSYHLLFHWPTLPADPFRPEFAAFPWTENVAHLAAWQRGLTGFPIVDAGMRELWQTGWMHNRVRMIAASFLVKDLLIPWQQGERWFWDTLVDADLASNAASWQWVAGSGADAAPYFRIFNPTTQGAKFDPDGAYIRRFVPELASLPAAFIHEPAAAPDGALRMAGVVLGKTYPLPIVDHGKARVGALAAYEAVKARAAESR